MNYHDIKKDDLVNGDGIRVTLFVAGCEHHCKGCQNPQTWNPKGGIPFDEDAEKEIFAELEKEYIDGITISGGDPFYISNYFDVLHLVKEIKRNYPTKTIWIYTGYSFRSVAHTELAQYVDVIVDEKFVEELKDNNAQWVGSTNQKVIRLTE